MRIVGAYALVSAILAVTFATALLTGGFRAIERSDYLTYHVAARIVLEGDGECLYDEACQAQVQQELIGEEPSFEGGTLPYNSPPWFAALMAPFGLLSLQAGFVVFTVLGLTVLAWGAWRVAVWDAASQATRLLAVVLVLTAWPTVMGAIRGQLTLAVAGLLAISVGGSGLALGLATIKPTLVPVWTAWLIAHARWRQVGVALAVVGGLVLLGLVVASPQALLDYPSHLLGVAGEDASGVHVEEMVNWRGVAERLGLGGWFVIAASVATLITVAYGWWRNRSLLIGAAIAFLATPLVIPHANQHEAILAELGVVLAIAALPAMRRSLIVAAAATHAALWTGPVLQAFSGEASAWLLFGAIAVWFAAVTWLALSPVPSREGDFSPVSVRQRTD